MTDKGYGLLRFGNICDVDASRGYARVEFDEDGITSAFLPVLVAGALQNKYFAMPAVNEQVVCIMDENCEQGVILGALYSKPNPPTGFGQGVSGVIYDDGGQFTYKGKFTFSNAVQSLASILSDLMDAHIAETHTTPSGPSGPPINLATYQAIKTRLDLLLE
jgi:phage baseplate assembly protein V